jgi:hypothetical protein
MIEKTQYETKHIEDIRGTFKTLLKEIKSLNKKDLKSLGDEYYEDIKETLHVEEIKDSVDNSLSELETSIQKQPLRSAAICLGIGFILAKVFGTWKNG